MVYEESGYSGIVLDALTKIGAQIGDRILITNQDSEYQGTLMPRAQIGTDPGHLVIKMDNGYNVGVRVSDATTISLVSKARRRRISRSSDEFTPSDDLPTVAVLSTGGTIASKVDYRTGAVNPALTAKDLYDAVPELRDFANIQASVIMSKFSEDVTPSDWVLIAKKAASVIRRGVDGVVIAHGTDTLGFTSAALSFALQDLPIPVVMVGSQRSSDRPSSDAALNLIAATRIASAADAAEVLLAMHGTPDDTVVLAHRGTRVRKCHTSRRDAFQSIDASPIFSVEGDSIKELSPPLQRRDPGRRLKVRARFEEKVALIRVHPGISSRLIDHLVSDGYRGIVLEGTGLGHAPETLLSSLKGAIDEGVVVAMTSQCIWGRIDMNVYRTGVELLDIGVIPCGNMLPETALVKLMWVLANVKASDRIRTELLHPLSGEITSRTELSLQSIRRL
ncbi:MAG: Glu-tRNA(Gln) amidotransferase subunit GatD [Candidatus Thorarchaeota archaeon]|nr:Glu-tRNA(Gln) amidotransferase subunit GatD [Candidatus Thorarchaeota archaeon]